MKKIINRFVIFFAVLFLLTALLPVYADEDIPVLEKPAGFYVRSDESGGLFLRVTHSDRMMQLIDNIDIMCEFDWRINDGPWALNPQWGEYITGELIQYYGLNEWPWFLSRMGNLYHDAGNAVDILVFSGTIQVDEIDLKNNTYYFRCRYLYQYPVYDEARGTWGYRIISSPYSDVAAIGKGVQAEFPDSIREAGTLKGEVRDREDVGVPYFYFTCDIPGSIYELNKRTRVWNEIDYKAGDDKWASEKNQFLIANGYLMSWNYYDPIDYEGRDVNAKEKAYYFRMRFCYTKPDGTIVRSSFSNVVTFGAQSFYKNASSWAVGELQAAYEKGLIPDILLGADMTQPITREEFAELAVRLCEETMGQVVQPASPNPFTDTTNPQILKAYQLGITTGTSKTTFSPNMLINREQCATMLYRAIRAIAPDADYSITGVKDFPDQKDISSWAVEGTKYMFKLGIIKGDSNGNFMPKVVTYAQEAAGYGMATREAAILMTVRTFDKIPEIQESRAQTTVTPAPKQTEVPSPKPTATPAPGSGISPVGLELGELIAKSNKITRVYYEWMSYIDGEPLMGGKAWMKGNMAKRQEPTNTGDNRIFIYDMEKGEFISYTEGDNVAYRGTYDPDTPELLTKPTDIRGWLYPEILINAGTDTLNGIPCTVFMGVEEDGTEIVKVWVSEETGLKLREEIILVPGYPKVTYEYTYIIINGPVDDSVFELPDGMTIENMDW